MKIVSLAFNFLDSPVSGSSPAAGCTGPAGRPGPGALAGSAKQARDEAAVSTPGSIANRVA